jgi:formylglycine-generating enzyme required for sulfatase activity
LICHGDVLIDLTYIGNPGNPDDDPPGDFIGGGVNYIYQIGTYETTVAQYTEFLNAKARSDPYGLYNSAMEGGTPEGAFIIRSGSDGSYTYTAVSGKENQPVRWVSFFDTLRFCNWMHNGQGDGDTETGAYNLSLGLSVEREPRATWALSSEDEWYKAAYYDPDAGVYYDYPNGSDDVPAEPTDGTTLREMNFGELPYWAPEGDRLYITSIGETTGRSPYGTYDQGGNVREWLETASIQFPDRNVRGGGTFSSEAEDLSSNRGFGYDPDAEGLFGFRLVHLIPEPSTALLGLSGLLVMGLLRRRRV